MSEAVFIRKVLKAGRFNDILKAVTYFGFDTGCNALPGIKDDVIIDKVIALLLRIQKGMLQARCQQHDLKPFQSQ